MNNLTIGQVLSNNELVAAFKCGNMGGMRRSKATNTLVLISDHTKGLYEDRWHGDILHYTGMGKKGDQQLVNQNRTLFESRTNGIVVHLFEVIQPKQYTYYGIAKLVSEPYQETQPDEDGAHRKVWMFPIGLSASFPVIAGEAWFEQEEIQEKKAQSLSLNDLESMAKVNETDKVPVRSIETKVYARNAYVSELAKRKAKGNCQLCKQPAPFKTKDGVPYLETHHIEWLSAGGGDTISNTVALCPNCHKKMHILNLYSDILKLRSSKHG